MFSDAHVHMTEPGFEYVMDDVHLILSNTSRPSEFDSLREMSAKDERIVPFYGVHPWFCDEYERDALESILRSDEKANIGEIGLDTKKAKEKDQLSVFIDQLDLAEKYGRMVTIHMVGSEADVLRTLRGRRLKVILHSFIGPESYIGPFAECGCFFSVSPRLFAKSKDKVSSILGSIPRDRLLLETDSPNNRSNIGDIVSLAGKVGEFLGITGDDVLRITDDNLRSLLEPTK